MKMNKKSHHYLNSNLTPQQKLMSQQLNGIRKQHDKNVGNVAVHFINSMIVMSIKPKSFATIVVSLELLY